MTCLCYATMHGRTANVEATAGHSRLAGWNSLRHRPVHRSNAGPLQWSIAFKVHVDLSRNKIAVCMRLHLMEPPTHDLRCTHRAPCKQRVDTSFVQASTCARCSVSLRNTCTVAQVIHHPDFTNTYSSHQTRHAVFNYAMPRQRLRFFIDLDTQSFASIK